MSMISPKVVSVTGGGGGGGMIMRLVTVELR